MRVRFRRYPRGQTEKQTDRHTGTRTQSHTYTQTYSSQYFATAHQGEVIRILLSLLILVVF